MTNQMVRFLIIYPYPIIPPNYGGALVPYNLANSLIKKGHQVTLMAPVNSRNCEEFIMENSVKVLGLPRRDRLFSLVISLLTDKAYGEARIKASVHLKGWLKEKILESGIDVIVFNQYESAVLYELLRDLQIQKVFYAHNIDYEFFRHAVKDTTNLLRKFIFFESYLKAFKKEPEYIRKFKKIFAVSMDDAKRIAEINPGAKVLWLPPILQTPKQKTVELSSIPRELQNYERRILFLGSLDMPSNINGLKWFFKDVKKYLSNDSVIIIAGRNPSKEVINLQGDRVFVIPNVKNVDEIYSVADLVIVPTFNPAGIKIKLLEALSRRKKVVSTPEAVVGSGFENLIPATRDPRLFAKYCNDALNGEIDYEPSWKFFEQEYSEDKIVSTFLDNIYTP